MATMDEKEKMHRGMSAMEQSKPEKKEAKDEKKKSTLESIKDGVEGFLERIPRGQRIEQGTHMFKKGGKVGGASKRADGCAIRGKTKGRMV